MTNIYRKLCTHELGMNKNETLNFLNEYIESQKENIEEDDYKMDSLMPGNVFN